MAYVYAEESREKSTGTGIETNCVYVVCKERMGIIGIIKWEIVIVYTSKKRALEAVAKYKKLATKYNYFCRKAYFNKEE